MEEEAKDFLGKIQAAVAADQVEITSHLEQRLGERGFLWADVLTMLEEPTRMENQGLDAHGWPRWRIFGKTAAQVDAALVVALRDDGGARFITIHWED